MNTIATSKGNKAVPRLSSINGIVAALQTPTPQPMATISLAATKTPVKAFTWRELEVPPMQDFSICGVSTLLDDKRPGRSETIVVSDLHSPGIREDLLWYIAKRHEGSRLVIPGDIFHNDKASRFSRRKYSCSRSPEGSMSLHEIKEFTLAALFRIHEFFEDIVILRGNHDERMAQAIALATDGDASEIDYSFKEAFESRIPNCTVRHGTARAMQMMKRGDAYIGHFERYGIPKLAGAIKVIDWLLDDPEAASAGEWNVVVQAHTHKLGKALHKRKLALECGALTNIPDYYDAKLGTHGPPQLGYVHLVQHDGVTDIMESDAKFFPLKYHMERMEIGGYSGQVYGSHNQD